MRQRTNGVSTIGEVIAKVDDEERYARLLPEELVDWILFEAPVPFTYKSVYGLTLDISPCSALLQALKGAMADDLSKVLTQQGIDPTTHPYILKHGKRK
jgi:hypothetical protein